MTGASSGFGREFALQLAAKGMDVVVVARRQALLDELAQEVARKHRVRCVALAQDLLAQDAGDTLATAVEEAGLHVGLLINNAGFGSYGLFQEQDRGAEGRMVDLNCRVPVTLTHRFLPGMLERGRGGMILVSSMAAFQPTPWMVTYGATKAFGLSFAEGLWAELGPKGIDVLALCPGKVDTGFQAVAGSEAMPTIGSKTTIGEVVEVGLKQLGKRPSIVPGLMSKLLIGSQRLAPRSVVASSALKMNAPLKK